MRFIVWAPGEYTNAGGGMDGNKAELISRFEKAGYKTDTIDYQTFTAEWS